MDDYSIGDDCSFHNILYTILDDRMIGEILLVIVYLIISRVIAVFGSAIYGLEKIDNLQKYISLSALYGVEGWTTIWSIKAIKKGIIYYEQKRNQ